MENPDLKRSANPVILALGGLLVALAIVTCAMGVFSLFSSETPAFSGLDKIADKGFEDYFGSEVMAAAMFNHYIAIFLKPFLMVAIGLVILLLGIILCALARPHIMIRRPIHIHKSIAKQGSKGSLKVQNADFQKMGSWLKALNLTPFQWILAILAVVFALNYSPALAGISFGALAVMLWQKYASEGIIIETINSEGDEEPELADEEEEQNEIANSDPE